MRWINGFLMLVIVVGLIQCLRISGEYLRVQSLQADVSRGIELSVADRSKINVQKLSNDDPLLFEWYVYVPEDIGCAHMTRTVSYAPRTEFSTESQSIFRVRVRKINDRWILWSQMGYGVSQSWTIRSNADLAEPSQFSVQTPEVSAPLLLGENDTVELLHIVAANGDPIALVNLGGLQGMAKLESEIK